MRLFVSGFIVALATLAGAALVPASAASAGIGVTAGNTAVQPAPIVEKATYYGHRRYRYYGGHRGYRHSYYGHRRYGHRRHFRGFGLYFGRRGHHRRHGYRYGRHHW